MPQQHGSCIIASVRAGGIGRGSTRAHPSVMTRPQRAGTTLHMRSPTPWHAHAISERKAWPAPHASTAGRVVLVGLRAHNARSAHTNRPRSPLAPAHIRHMTRQRA
eukprot:2532984-Prymnesium_polylepis.1